jgi:hypothetical protein
MSGFHVTMINCHPIQDQPVGSIEGQQSSQVNRAALCHEMLFHIANASIQIRQA